MPGAGRPKATYIFKHALVQDAAYRKPPALDASTAPWPIAQAITELMPQIAETQPELLAHHYAQAGLIDDAIAYGLKAGRTLCRAFRQRRGDHALHQSTGVAGDQIGGD